MSWRDTGLTTLLDVPLPIIQAPMAGGWTTPALVAAVSTAGGLGTIAGAMLGPDALRDFIREVRGRTEEQFAVNLFAPLPPPAEDRLVEWSALTGVPVPPWVPAPAYADQLAVVVEERVPVLSFTFGVPPLDGFAGVTIGTATTVAEAVALEQAGVSAVVVQGAEAGGHRGTFLAPVEQSLIATMTLVPQVADAVAIPVIAAGGIMDGRGVAAALALGADAAQLGTAFLGCDESGAGAAYRAAIGGQTVITRVLTGRHARAVRTPLVDRLEAAGIEPPDYPLPRGLLPEPPMLAGQGGALLRSMPAAELVAVLAREADAAVARLA